MIGERTATGNLDQRCDTAPRRLAAGKHARSATGGHRRLTMPLAKALVDVKLGIAEIRIKKTR
jgi:hypothetical protein